MESKKYISFQLSTLYFFSIKMYQNSLEVSLDLKFEPSLKVNRKGLD